ncbi:MAG: lysophospholipase [Chloroflexi bacterium]|nr:lysophospholipase [Chloroflexota bacterium]
MAANCGQNPPARRHFQGGNDPAVHTDYVEQLFQKLATADKEMKFFPQAGHELMRPEEPIT